MSIFCRIPSTDTPEAVFTITDITNLLAGLFQLKIRRCKRPVLAPEFAQCNFSAQENTFSGT